MFAKSDESLYPKGPMPFGLKPRTIGAVTTAVQAATQPWIRSAMRRFKRAIRAQAIPVRIRGSRVIRSTWFDCASGMVGRDLDEWLRVANERAANGESSFIVMGDDVIGVVVVDGQIDYIEIDYSNYDQSQSGCIYAAEMKGLLALGVPSAIVDILTAACKTHMKYGKQGIKLQFSKHGPVRVSGLADTTLSNSLGNILGLMIAYAYNFSDEGWQAAGLRAKMHRSHDVGDLTFLRGRFYAAAEPEYVGHRVWGWMPSAVVKLGKVKKKQGTIKSLAEVMTVAYGNAMTIAPGATNIPVVAAFRAALYRNARAGDGLSERNAYRISSSTTLVDRDEALRWMFTRYAITREQVEDIEALLAEVTSLPAYVGHLGFNRLVDVDYGKGVPVP